MLKRYTAGKLSKSADKKNKEVNESMESKSKDDDLNDEHSVIDQTTLDQMKDDWTGTLPSVRVLRIENLVIFLKRCID